MINIQSNAIRGDYLHEIMDKTMKELHDDIVTVFGPYAKDAYLTQNGLPYYTRDGKETLRLTRFDNELSMYVLKILYQAVQQQGNKVGDGTTSLGVLYTNMYKTIREMVVVSGDTITRKEWEKVAKDICTEIEKYKIPMTKESLHQMLYTCVQDPDWAATIEYNLADAIMSGAYITVAKSNLATDFNMTVHNSPLFKATKQFSIRPMKDVEKECVIFHCNGILDIAHTEVMQAMMGYVAQDTTGKFYPKTIIILCNGLSEASRRTLKSMITDLNTMRGSTPADEFFKDYNNIAVFTLDDYRAYGPEVLEDISTIITDEKGIGGLVNQLTFETLIWQSIASNKDMIPELCTFDCDVRHLAKIQDMFTESYQVDIDDVKGIRIHKKLGPVAQARYDELRKEMDEEKSEIKKLELNKRLRTSYGQFIEVEIGSKLMKDSQRKYELILDAILSSAEAVEKGILTCNSLALAAYVAHNYCVTAAHECDSKKERIGSIFESAFINTLTDMIYNGPFDVDYNELHDAVVKYIADPNSHIENFNLKGITDLNDIFTPDEINGPDTHYKEFGTYTSSDGEEVTTQYSNQIIEPVSIITTMIENSTLVYELATARTVHLEGFIQNYI